MKIFSILDVKAKAYLQPVFFANRDVAIRSCQSMLKSKDNQFVEYPEDYSLYELGEFDSMTGVIIAHSVPLLVGQLVDYCSK